MSEHTTRCDLSEQSAATPKAREKRWQRFSFPFEPRGRAPHSRGSEQRVSQPNAIYACLSKFTARRTAPRPREATREHVHAQSHARANTNEHKRIVRKV
eukprot:1189757-Pleurochrysis_carterae.AAC.1